MCAPEDLQLRGDVGEETPGSQGHFGEWGSLSERAGDTADGTVTDTHTHTQTLINVINMLQSVQN